MGKQRDKKGEHKVRPYDAAGTFPGLFSFRLPRVGAGGYLSSLERLTHLRILVTGAAGKIGSRVVMELVQHGHAVRALDRRPMPAEVRASADTLYADLADAPALLNAVQGCGAVAHIGAIPQPSLPPDEMLRLNVIGTQKRAGSRPRRRHP